MWKLPLFVLEFFDPDVAIGFSAGLVIIMLVIFFCGPEGGGRGKPGVYLIAFIFQNLNDFFGLPLLFFVQIEDFTAVLRADIWALSVGLCRIMYLKKQFTQIGISGFCGIVFHKHRFRMSGSMGFYFRVSGVFLVSSCISYGSTYHSCSTFHLVLDTPEASTGKNRFFGFHNFLAFMYK